MNQEIVTSTQDEPTAASTTTPDLQPLVYSKRTFNAADGTDMKLSASTRHADVLLSSTINETREEDGVVSTTCKTPDKLTWRLKKSSAAQRMANILVGRSVKW